MSLMNFICYGIIKRRYC